MKVNFTDILTNEFLQKYTEWKDVKDFEQNSPIDLAAEYYWPHINKPEFNQYIAGHSEFRTWNHMVRQATKEFMAIRIGA